MKLTRWLLGWVRFRVLPPRGGERFLSCCMRGGVRLWQVRPGQKGMTACVQVKMYPKLRREARQARVRLQIVKRSGLPLKIARLRGRPGLVAGFALFWAVLLGLGQFFWTVEISGCRTIAEPALRAALAQQGAFPGAVRHGFSAKDVQTQLMQQFPRISWISINNHGGDLDVQLTENDERPPVADQSGWYELQAAENGVVLEMHIRAGTAKVQPGDGVSKGQLLVSPVVENKEEKFMALYHASGTVFAKTAHTLKVTVPFAARRREQTGAPAERKSLAVFGVQLPLSLGLPPQGSVVRTGEQTCVRLWGKELPLLFTREVLTPVREVSWRRTPQQAVQEARRLLRQKEKTELPGAAVLSRSDSVKTEKDGVTVTRSLFCRENIAKEVRISQTALPGT
ncbi:MAG: sporulation protein YqfD [Oscillospiraceae bacterium]|jgi:similar to stage IV sporulation protein|nr:sporulation protein YqfD [Oscillospiraceae bacterium]MDD3261037.1 sporulation protein YqfD [Oscillospiraceae bacterium]